MCKVSFSYIVCSRPGLNEPLFQNKQKNWSWFSFLTQGSLAEPADLVLGQGGTFPSPAALALLSTLSHSLELVDDNHPYILPGLQDLLQPMDIIGVGVPEGNVIREAFHFHSIWAVTDQFVRDQHRPIQSQGLT